MVKRYVMVTNDGSHFPALVTPLEKIVRPGSYQWYKAFEADPEWTGEVRHIRSLSYEELRKYDVIHINLCGANLNLVSQVKRMIQGSKAKLILNVDYPPDSPQFREAFYSPNTFLLALFQADFLFANEPYQQALLTYLINRTNLSGVKNPFLDRGLEVPLIPHPVNVRQLKSLRVPLEDRQDRVVYCFHRYERQQHIPGWITLKLRLPTGEYVPRYMVNFLPDARHRDIVAPMFLFDFCGSVATEANWGKYIYTLAHSTVGFEYYVSIHSHGRFPSECACLGLPCVGTDRSYSVTKLFPKTCHDPLDLEGIRNSLERLLADEAFYREVVDYADKAVEELSWANSLAKLLGEMERWDIRFE